MAQRNREVSAHRPGVTARADKKTKNMSKSGKIGECIDLVSSLIDAMDDYPELTPWYDILKILEYRLTNCE